MQEILPREEGQTLLTDTSPEIPHPKMLLQRMITFSIIRHGLNPWQSFIELGGKLV
jgi:hypothetical protein